MDWLVRLMMALFLGVLPGARAVVPVDAFAYDAPTIVRVDSEECCATDSVQAQPSDVLVGATSPSAVSRGTSTTTAGMATKPRSPCHSFRSDTTVLMYDGSRKRISEMEVGDLVLMTDPDTGEPVVREVTELHVNRDRKMANVTVRDENGKRSTIYTTQMHQFWSQTDNEWADVEDLDSGDLLRAFDGSTVTVVGVRSWDGMQTMYDLTVDGVHTYYVTTGNEEVLVHNCGWGNPATLDDHFVRHGPDFGAPSANAYVSLADDFYAARSQYLVKVERTAGGQVKTIRVYDPASNTFGSYNPDGTIKTFYKPTGGQAYWDGQPGS